MEDLKQIQEFFSKPLNEISKEEAWKKFQKEKSVTDKTIKAARKDFEKEWEAGKLKENSRRSPDFILTDPAEIKYTESFGTGIKAPGVLHHANAGAFLGAEGAYIIVLPGGTFYVDEDKEEAMPIWPLKDQDQELHQVLDYTPFSPKYETWKSWIKRPKTLDEDKKLTYNDFVRMVRDDMMVGAAPDEYPSDEDDERIRKNAKYLYNRYLQGASVDDLFEATKEEETEFHAKLDKLVHDTFGKRKGELEESSTSEERRIAKRAIRSIAKYRGVSEDEARNDLIRAANELGSLEKAVRKMFETIKLGKQLNEELCDKGKRYIKARQAAGEKSSAYLSGRAVRVCKGQIEWPKKGKKK